MSLQDDIFLEIPPGAIVVKYLVFIPLNFWESDSNLANTKYLTTT